MLLAGPPLFPPPTFMPSMLCCRLGGADDCRMGHEARFAWFENEDGCIVCMILYCYLIVLDGCQVDIIDEDEGPCAPNTPCKERGKRCVVCVPQGIWGSCMWGMDNLGLG